MNFKRIISSFLVIVFALTIPAFASNRASNQISSYMIEVLPTTDTLNIEYSVSGTNVMTKIGCESIYIYQKSGSTWKLIETLDEDDTGMSRANVRTHKNTIYCDSKVNVSYKVAVTIFAENSSGRDTRTKTVYVTGK